MELKIGIIGAGIIGLYTGYILLKEDYEVDIYEARHKVGYGASTLNPGVLNMLQHPFRSFKTKLMLEGNRLHRLYSEELGYNIMDVDLVMVYKDLIHRVISPLVPTYMRRYGIELRRIGEDDLKKNYPDVNPIYKGAFIVSGYGIVNPYEVLDRLVDGIRELGGRIFFNRRISRVMGEPVLEGVEYDYVVVSAGPYTLDITRNIDPKPPKQRFGKGVMVIVSCNLDYILNEFRVRRMRYTKGGAIIPYYKGKWCIIGPSFEWVDTKENVEVEREEAYRVYLEYVDLLRDMPEIIDYMAGVRIVNYPKDEWIIKKIDRFIIPYGIDSPGLTAAPALAKYIMDMMIKGD